MPRSIPARTIGRTASLAALITAGASAQDGAEWTKLTVKPTDRDLYGAAFATPDHGFVISHNHGLFETLDRGRTWAQRSLDAQGTDPYYDIHFFDDTHGWISGNNADGLRTTDGGQTWEPMGQELLGSWNAMHFESPLVGIIMANGACAGTSDGGINWDIRSAYPDCPITYGAAFLTATTGLVCGHQLSTSLDGIFRTADGGRTWSQVLDAKINDVVFVDQTTALATGVLPSRTYRSTDAGRTWTPLPRVFDEHGPLGDLALFGGTTIAGASHYGDVWISHDLGDTWTQTLDPLGDLPYWWELNYGGDGVGVMTGSRGILYRTADDGQTWEYVTRGVGVDLNEIEMHTDRFGIAVGLNGYLALTRDAGATWEVQKLGVQGQIFGSDESLESVHILNDDFAVVAGPGGIVFKTSNAGGSWTSIGYPMLPSSLEIHDVFARSEADIWVVGWNNAAGHRFEAAYHTTNGGASWSVPFEEGILEHVQWINESGWIMHTGGLLLRTDDGGVIWDEVALPGTYFGDNATIEDMEFLDENVGWVVGWWDYAARTLDGGRTWQDLNFGNNHDIRVAHGVAAISPTEAWVVATLGNGAPVSLHTIDGGATWSRAMPTAIPDVPWHIDATPSGDLFAAGRGGYVATTAARCEADLDGDGDADGDDFFSYLDLFAAGDAAADLDGDGDRDADDFFLYLDRFALGC